MALVVKCSEILAHIELRNNPRVNKVFTHSLHSLTHSLTHTHSLTLTVPSIGLYKLLAGLSCYSFSFLLRKVIISRLCYTLISGPMIFEVHLFQWNTQYSVYRHLNKMPLAYVQRLFINDLNTFPQTPHFCMKTAHTLTNWKLFRTLHFCLTYIELHQFFSCRGALRSPRTRWPSSLVVEFLLLLLLWSRLNST